MRTKRHQRRRRAEGFTSADATEDLHTLIAELGVVPAHIAVQDIAGGSVYRLTTEHPDDILSLTATGMGLAGFGRHAGTPHRSLSLQVDEPLPS